jgi:hypothetical protein
MAQEPQKRLDVAVRVFRVEKASICWVRTLAGQYGGLQTHYRKTGSLICGGDQCPSWLHKEDPVFKGYTPVELYIEREQLWLPVVLEVTENLDHVMYDTIARGQVWELERKPGPKGKRQPVEGRLTEVLKHAQLLPPAFCVEAALCRLYHVDAIRLDQRNHVPKPQCLEPSFDGPPEAAKKRMQAKAPPPPLTPEEIEKRAKLIERLRGQTKPAVNGVQH